MIYQIALRSYRINGIYHKIKRRTVQQFRYSLIFQVNRQHGQLQFRINIPETFSQYLCLWTSDNGMSGRQLTVDVTRLYRIGIYNRHPSHSGTANHFSRIRTYSSQAYHQHMRLTQTLHLLFA